MRKRLRVYADLRVRMMGLAMLAAPLAALCALTFSIRTLQIERREAEERLRQTVELHHEVQGLHADLFGAGTAVGAYLLQGRDEGLAPFKAARESLPERLTRIEKLLNADPAQSERSKRIRPAVERYIEILSDSRKYAAIPGFSPANPPDDLIAEQASVTNRFRSFWGKSNRKKTLGLS